MERLYYKAKDGFVLRELAGEHVVIYKGDGDFDGLVRLNGEGIFVWERIAEGATGEELLGALCQEYDADREQIAKDLDAVLNELVSEGVVRVMRDSR